MNSEGEMEHPAFIAIVSCTRMACSENCIQPVRKCFGNAIYRQTDKPMTMAIYIYNYNILAFLHKWNGDKYNTG